ncbi:MAG TPA: tetratricopeptide repeat protein [bacterium]|nr:tetratricopeptide repeat protein [bacterium]
MAQELNFYEILELYPAATQEEIDNAFRLMLYKYHPDHNPERPDWAHEKTSRAVEAYKVLSHPLRRKIYNFMIFAVLKKNPAERKFNVFQGGEKKKYEQARRLFEEGVNNYDVNKGAAMGKFQQSYGTYKMSETMYNLGVLYTATNKLEEALRAFMEAVKLDPDAVHYSRTLEKFRELKIEIERAKKSSV